MRKLSALAIFATLLITTCSCNQKFSDGVTIVDYSSFIGRSCVDVCEYYADTAAQGWMHTTEAVDVYVVRSISFSVAVVLDKSDGKAYEVCADNIVDCIERANGLCDMSWLDSENPDVSFVADTLVSDGYISEDGEWAHKIIDGEVYLWPIACMDSVNTWSTDVASVSVLPSTDKFDPTVVIGGMYSDAEYVNDDEHYVKYVDEGIYQCLLQHTREGEYVYLASHYKNKTVLLTSYSQTDSEELLSVISKYGFTDVFTSLIRGEIYAV